MFITRLIERWAVGSQQAARRNAMIASTALTQRRAELIEVEDYFANLRESSSYGVAAGAAAHG